jgi:hypothetical protein
LSRQLDIFTETNNNPTLSRDITKLTLLTQGAILGSNFTLSACTSSLPSDDTAVAIGFPPANCLSICSSRSSGYAAMARIPSEGGWECWCPSDLSSGSGSSSCDGDSLWVYANPAIQKTIGSNAAVVLWSAWTSNGANQYATSERDATTGTEGGCLDRRAAGQAWRGMVVLYA